MDSTLFTILGTTLALLAFTLLFLWSSYNGFIVKRNQVKADFSDIDIQLKRRADLIDQLVQMVREYAKHEKDTFVDVTKARSQLDHSSSVKDMAVAENMFTQTLKSLFAVVENYPKLKANENYKELINNLRQTEDNIARYREEYNTSVQEYNNKVQVFPNLIAASFFKFYTEEYFTISGTADKAS